MLFICEAWRLGCGNQARWIYVYNTFDLLWYVCLIRLVGWWLSFIVARHVVGAVWLIQQYMRSKLLFECCCVYNFGVLLNCVFVRQTTRAAQVDECVDECNFL